MVNRNHFITHREREALISVVAIQYIEEHALLSGGQLEGAKQSLQALFLHATGEESALRRLIDVLRMTRAVHQSFSSISRVLDGAHQSVAAVDEKVGVLRQRLQQAPVSAEAQAEFVGPFLSFSQMIVQRMTEFGRLLAEYLALREAEARASLFYRIALEARERLRERLAGRLAAEPQGETESRIKQELTTSFDYGEAESNVKASAREARTRAAEVEDALARLKDLCQLAMNPSMRDPHARPSAAQDDVFVRFAETLPRRPELEPLKPRVLELFKLYQHTFGMFNLDYEKLKRATETMMQNTEAYFQAKEEDRDLGVKREKLRRIEALIPFLEQSASLANADTSDTFPKFSRELSALIAHRRSPWSHIAEDLLRAKVQAEADLSTRF